MQISGVIFTWLWRIALPRGKNKRKIATKAWWRSTTQLNNMCDWNTLYLVSRAQHWRRKSFPRGVSVDFYRDGQRLFSRGGPTVVKFRFTKSKQREKHFFCKKVDKKISNFKIKGDKSPLPVLIERNNSTRSNQRKTPWQFVRWLRAMVTYYEEPSCKYKEQSP